MLVYSLGAPRKVRVKTAKDVILPLPLGGRGLG